MPLFALIFVVTSGAQLGTMNPTHLYPSMAVCVAQEAIAQDWANTHKDLLKSHGVDTWAFVCSHTDTKPVIIPADPDKRI